MLRAWMLAAVLLLAIPAGAAALPRAHPPDTAKLARQGVHVTWPLGRWLAGPPGMRVSVPVTSRRPVTVSLDVVDESGWPVRTLARKRLRRGVFTHTLGKGPVALSLQVGKARYWSWIRLESRSDLGCEHGRSGVLDVAVDGALRAGHPFTLRFRNAGRCPQAVWDPLTPDWQRPTPEGGWEPVLVQCGAVVAVRDLNSMCSDTMRLYDVVAPGGERTVSRHVPLGLPAGPYRLEIRPGPGGSPMHAGVVVDP